MAKIKKANGAVVIKNMSKIKMKDKQTLAFIFLSLILFSGNVLADKSIIAHAHFSTAFMHTFIGLDHMIFMFGLGMLAVKIKVNNIWILPFSFLSFMIAGLLLSSLFQFNYLEQGIALSLIVIGLFIFVREKIATHAVLIIASLFALLHGYTHGIELVAERHTMLVTLAMTSATLLLQIMGVLVAISMHQYLRGNLYRMSGILISMYGGFYLLISI